MSVHARGVKEFKYRPSERRGRSEVVEVVRRMISHT